MIIKNLPQEIQDLVKVRWENHHDLSIYPFDVEDELTGGFAFHNTPEGSNFWWAIDTGKYDEFFEKYPKRESKLTNYVKSGTLHIYYAKVGDRKVKVTIEYEK